MSDSSKIPISRELADRLIESIVFLMRANNPNSQRADCMCEFCYNCPDTNDGEIVHRDDCEGVKFLEELKMAYNDQR